MMLHWHGILQLVKLVSLVPRKTSSLSTSESELSYSCPNSSVVIGFGLSQVLECPDHRQKFCIVMNIPFLHQNHSKIIKVVCHSAFFLFFSVDHLPCNALILQLLHLFLQLLHLLTRKSDLLGVCFYSLSWF